MKAHKRWTFLPVCALLFFGFSSEYGGAQDLSDFGLTAPSTQERGPGDALPLDQPGSAKVVVNEQLGLPVTSAQTQDDAVRAAFNRLEGAPGAAFFASNSGIGVIATGIAGYGGEGVTNSNLIALQQRAAFVEARVSALAEIRKFMEGLTLEQLQVVESQLQILDLATEARANQDKSTTETRSSLVQGMVRGAVIYELVDDPEEGVVAVRLVTTPKTQGALTRERMDFLSAAELEVGIADILREVRLGVVPPEGGRTVVSADGSVAWVGFGSALCRKNRNASLERELRQDARRSSVQRASASLLALLQGEEVVDRQRSTDRLDQAINQFDIQVAEDGSESTETLDQDRVEVSASRLSLRSLSGEVSGELPPGVNTRSFFSEDGRWSHSISIYTQSSTRQAKAIADAMADNNPLRHKNVADYEVRADGAFRLDEEGRLVPKSLGNGRVARDKDL